MDKKNKKDMPIQSIAGTARLLCCSKTFRNRLDLAKKVYEDFLKKGLTKTNKGKELTLDVVKNEIDVITREIKKGIGAKIWVHYKVVETPDEFRIVLK